jgi:prepilin-type N-terminal cleavage/methylation domain-containing protein
MTKGFSLLELLVVIVIIGLLVTGMSVAWQGVNNRVIEDMDAALALQTMTSIREATADFYSELELVPYDTFPPVASFGDNWEWQADYRLATRLLCAPLDCTESEIENAGRTINGVKTSYTYAGNTIKTVLMNESQDYIICDDLPAGCPSTEAMCRIIGSLEEDSLNRSDPLKDGRFLWDKYQATGWSGPAMTCNAHYLDSAALETPWAEQGDLWAILLDQLGYPAEAEEFRRAKYYQIHGGTKKMTHVLCRVPPALPMPEDELRKNLREAIADLSNKDRINMMTEAKNYILRGLTYLSFQKAYLEARDVRCTEDASGCFDTCAQTCLDACSEYTKKSDYDECMKECPDICVPNCLYKCRETVESRFYDKLTNSDNTDPDYIDTGDDIRMFVFGGDLRSPLDE